MSAPHKGEVRPGGFTGIEVWTGEAWVAFTEIREDPIQSRLDKIISLLEKLVEQKNE